MAVYGRLVKGMAGLNDCAARIRGYGGEKLCVKETPMKGLIAGAVLAIAAVVALQGGSDQPSNSDDSQLEQGVARFDHALESGLNSETHDAIAKQADSTAVWLQGFGAKVTSAAE
jgi:hypothetical protein